MKRLKVILENGINEEDTGNDLGLTVIKVKKNKNREIIDYTLGITIDDDNGSKVQKGGKWAAVANKLLNLIGKDTVMDDLKINPNVDTLIWIEIEKDKKGFFVEYGGKRIALPMA